MNRSARRLFGLSDDSDGSGILLDRTAASSGMDKAVFQAVMNGVTVDRLS